MAPDHDSTEPEPSGEPIAMLHDLELEPAGDLPHASDGASSGGF